MPDDFLSQIHPFDRLAIPAVRVPQGARLDQTATQMGLQDAVEIPVYFGDGDSSAFGDRHTANITGVFQPDTQEDEDGFRDASDVLGEIDKVRESEPDGPGIVPETGPSVVNRPQGAQGRSFAPVRGRSGADG